MVGTVASSTTIRISAALPRGITRSTLPRAVRSAFVVARSSEGTSWTTSGEILVSANASRIILTRISLLLRAVDDPRSSAAFPDINKITAASTVTLGRASYTIPITPNGTVICSNSSPLGSVERRNVCPSGSGSAATCRAPPAIPLMRSSVRSNRSCICGCIFSARALAISISLAARISALRASIAWAIASRAALRSAPVAVESVRAALRAVVASSATSDSALIGVLNHLYVLTRARILRRVMRQVLLLIDQASEEFLLSQMQLIHAQLLCLT